MAIDELVANGPVSFESAAQHASRDVPIAAPEHTVGAVRAELSGRSYACASHVVVCEGDRFAGVVRIEDLFAADAGARISRVMDAEAPAVAPGVDQEVAAAHAVRRGESALAVVDSEGRFVGVIPPHRLLAVLLSEHEEDLSRLGGFTKGATVARDTADEPVDRRFRRRVPWLLVGLAGALLAADLVGGFEAALHEQIMLAFFIPAIVYLADAVGTQTETVVVRGLSIGVDIRRMLGRELRAGFVMGLALAAVAGPLVWWHWGAGDVALTVALAVFAACSTATFTAIVLPWLLDAFDFDPALGSGPLATMIQDLLSILIYFAVAAAIVA
jgi:magnesium transporter